MSGVSFGDLGFDQLRDVRAATGDIGYESHLKRPTNALISDLENMS